MARNKFTFTSENNPRKRKPDLDLIGANAEQIDQAGRETAHLPGPRPHVTMRSMEPAPVVELSSLPAEEALFLAQQEGEAAAAMLKELAAEEKETEGNIADARRSLAERRLKVQQEQDAAREHEKDARRRIDAANAIKQAEATAARVKAEREAEVKREDGRRVAFAEEIKQAMRPVIKERQALSAMLADYEQPLKKIEAFTYSELPAAWPHQLRVNVEQIAGQAKTALADLKRALWQNDQVWNKASALVKQGPPASAEFFHEVKYAAGSHAWNIKTLIDNVISGWVTAQQEGARYAGAPAQPAPSMQDQQDPVRQMERGYQIEKAKRSVDQYGEVPDGAHKPEHTEQQQQAKQRAADPGRVDPNQDLPNPTRP